MARGDAPEPCRSRTSASVVSGADEGRFVITRHRGCGGETEIAVHCSSCGEELSARDVEAEPGPGLSAESRLATT